MNNTFAKRIGFIKFLRSEKRLNKKIRKECAKYPGWSQEDAFSCGPIKFIWGIKSSNDQPSVQASFDTLNDFEIHLDRRSGKYYLKFDNLEKLDTYQAQEEYLYNIQNKFSEYIHLSNPCGIVGQKECDLLSILSNPVFEADSILDLYYQFMYFYTGFKTMNA